MKYILGKIHCFLFLDKNIKSFLDSLLLISSLLIYIQFLLLCLFLFCRYPPTCKRVSSQKITFIIIFINNNVYETPTMCHV